MVKGHSLGQGVLGGGGGGRGAPKELEKFKGHQVACSCEIREHINIYLVKFLSCQLFFAFKLSSSILKETIFYSICEVTRKKGKIDAQFIDV